MDDRRQGTVHISGPEQGFTLINLCANQPGKQRVAFLTLNLGDYDQGESGPRPGWAGRREEEIRRHGGGGRLVPVMLNENVSNPA